MSDSKESIYSGQIASVPIYSGTARRFIIELNVSSCWKAQKGKERIREAPRKPFFFFLFSTADWPRRSEETATEIWHLGEAGVKCAAVFHHTPTESEAEWLRRGGWELDRGETDRLQIKWCIIKLLFHSLPLQHSNTNPPSPLKKVRKLVIWYHTLPSLSVSCSYLLLISPNLMAHGV